MKTSITKITAIALIASMLVITGSLCLKGHDSISASSGDIAMTDDAISDSFSADPCYRWQPVKLLSEKLMASIQSAQHGNSLLPCCYDSNRSDTASIFRSENLGQLAQTIFFTNAKLDRVLLAISTYKNPAISPPELPSILAVVIRT